MTANTQKIKQTLLTSIFEVFEKMFYVFLEAAEKSSWEPRYAVSITFTGPVNGRLRAFFSQGLSEVMVQNMLNLGKDEITETLREDCLKESVNMICGNFLRNYDSSRVFDLSLPVREAAQQGESEGSAEPAGQSLLLDFMSDNEKFGVACTITGE
jgi:CheY-specific phosphatase CheX